MAPLNIMITGAGIAGTALALMLVRQGHAVTVVERFPALRTSGLQLDLRGSGIDIVIRGRMGDTVSAGFLAASCPEEGLRFEDKQGKTWGYFPANKHSAAAKGGKKGGEKKKLQGFTTDYEIMRGDLCRLLYETAEREAGEKGPNANGGKVGWRFGTWVESYDENEEEGKVVVRFPDGGKETYDLVIGADGQGSRLRRMMTAKNTSSSSPGKESGPGVMSLNEDKAFIPFDGEYSGYYTMRVPKEENETAMATAFMAPGKGMLLRRNKPGVEQVYLGTTVKGENHPLTLAYQERDIAAQKAALVERYQDSGHHRTGALLKGLQEAEDFYLERYGVVKLDRWSSKGGRVVLVGDAAYSPSAKTGMGTTSAVTGAYILAGEIGRYCGLLEEDNQIVENGAGSHGNTVKTALESYERRFRPFMDQVQRGLPEDPSIMDWFMGTSMGIFLMYCMVSVASLFKVDILSKFQLREDVKDWELPEYGPVKKAS